jgi:hypothetical protein
LLNHSGAIRNMAQPHTAFERATINITLTVNVRAQTISTTCALTMRLGQLFDNTA